jgi:ABC-type oligopeptide transport system ATPase subunit
MIGIHSLRKTFKTGTDSVQAVDGVDLQVNEKEFFVLLGLSGSGKTTLLRCVAGLERPEAGEIFLGEQMVSSAERGIFITPEDRAIGMVFQSYAEREGCRDPKSESECWVLLKWSSYQPSPIDRFPFSAAVNSREWRWREHWLWSPRFF